MTRNSRHKKRGLHAFVIVIAVLLVAEVGLRAIEHQLPPATFGDGEELAIKRDQLRALASASASPQVIFLGGSGVDAGIDPAVFDSQSRYFTSSYNAAAVAMPVDMVLPWTEQVLAPSVSPQTIIVGVLPFQLGDFGTQVGGTENVAGYYSAYEASLKQLRPGVLQKVEDAASRSSVLIRNRHHLRDPAEMVRYIRAAITGADPAWSTATGAPERTRADWEALITDRGMNTLYRAVPEHATVDTAMAARYTDWITSEIDPAPLRTMLNGLRASGVDVVLFTLPLDRTTLGASGLDLALMDDVVDVIEDEAAMLDIPFVDLFRSPYDPLDFHDKVHLNERGALKLTADLAVAIDQFCDQGLLTSCGD